MATRKNQGKSNSGNDFQFGDERLNNRAVKMIKKMSKKSEKSIPQIFSSNAELHGAYRFLHNYNVSPEKILEPHKKMTIRRCAKLDCVVIIQDTSDVSFDHIQDLEGLGSTQSGIDRGIRLHPQLAVSESGTPLGVIDALMYTRLDNDKPTKHRNQLPIEEKESYRWLKGFISTCEIAKECPDTTFVSISDREGDIYECFEAALSPDMPANAHVLIRSQHNRVLSNPSSEMENKLERKLIRSSVAYSAEVTVNEKGKKKRSALVNIRAKNVSIKGPATSLKKKSPPLNLNAVMVSEVDPSKSCKPLSWVLLTTLPINTPEEIRRIVSLYMKRWQIEVYFKTLKSGCRIDALQLRSVSGIHNYMALSLIAAWKVMLTTYFPREYPNASCTTVFTDLEWRLVYLAAYENKKPLPEEPPTLMEITRLVASLGGYVKKKTPPGVQTVWRGIVRLMDMVEGYNMAQEIGKIPCQQVELIAMERCVEL